MPKGLFLPPSAEADSTSGRTGRMQGDAIRTMPSIKAEPISAKLMVILSLKKFMDCYQ